MSFICGSKMMILGVLIQKSRAVHTSTLKSIASFRHSILIPSVLIFRSLSLQCLRLSFFEEDVWPRTHGCA